ncbi:hypothetical protein M2459_002382 [Parabacteroides sp. PF5-5]|nr:hypothetical protein [Parabacteroides sp. PH5-39]MDH6316635.1 hypothetical protein [Parabacteroides sp. PF5-13]MDH6320185.1 hypothetical protein [Parabacteroides sp. PH5-13]MDH6323872.1 hypothetical protein [Parabacteroides sp. PH5-8]MDH6327862.1 hypothetical protein [Parabacteroides sp. PH5-41]MDH6335622.1 hypothetical protein [Parabacteroides sp. PF5-5]MDH6346726.1 hypothetical protein [Parabacteroides sp. PH5-46]MDH6361648.1 hypothetical protein [Parabacteroides sp. PH5-16]MDH6377315.
MRFADRMHAFSKLHPCVLLIARVQFLLHTKSCYFTHTGEIPQAGDLLLCARGTKYQYLS